MVRMCRLAPTMATLILAPWEFWLSCKNWDWGETPIFAFPRRVCAVLMGGRWVTLGLQGSDPLNLWPNSISPASLDHHYQTLSPRLSTIVILCQCRGKKVQYTHFLFIFVSLWNKNWNLIVLPQLRLVYMHRFESVQDGFVEELMLHWCLVAKGSGRGKDTTFLFSSAVTHCVHTNYPTFLFTDLAATQWAGVKLSSFIWGHLLKWLQTTVRLKHQEEGLGRGDSLNNGASSEKPPNLCG